MECKRLGRTALRVSELCLGTMNFGPLTTEPDSFVIMDRALELGINFFDTANRYGGPKGAGATETIVGNWFAQGGGRREKVVLATKVFGPMTEWPNDGGLSARHIRDACEASLRRLQTDHIDLYQMHHVDRNAPWDEVWQAMETLVEQGKVIYVGSSNFAGWHIAQANEAASKRNFLGLVSEQSLYNLASRTVELEVLPACRAYGLALIPWSPLAGGMLGGMLKAEATGRRKNLNPRYESMRPQIARWEELCEQLGEEPAAVALAWLLAQEGVTSPIIGPRTRSRAGRRRGGRP
jgi:aryl-alcohol dehydrogenase-like predicted oxidoreductase